MTSTTITLSGDSAFLTASFFPEIQLDENSSYSCGLLDFTTYNSMPNVTSDNNRIICYQNTGTKINKFFFEIPIGSYELEDIFKFLTDELKNKEFDVKFKLNKNTMKCMMQATNVNVDFDDDRSIGKLLGFSRDQYKIRSGWYESKNVVRITEINVIRIECDIVRGSYINGKPTHTIHQFAPTVAPGYKIIEVPKNIIYLPIFVRRLNSLQIKLTNQNGDPLNLRGETVTCRLHIKKDS